MSIFGRQDFADSSEFIGLADGRTLMLARVAGGQSSRVVLPNAYIDHIGIVDGDVGQPFPNKTMHGAARFVVVGGEGEISLHRSMRSDHSLKTKPMTIAIPNQQTNGTKRAAQ